MDKYHQYRNSMNFKKAQEERNRTLFGLDTFLSGFGTYRFLNKRMEEFFDNKWNLYRPGRLVEFTAGPGQFVIWALCTHEPKKFRYFNTKKEARGFAMLHSYDTNLTFLRAGHLAPKKRTVPSWDPTMQWIA